MSVLVPVSVTVAVVISVQVVVIVTRGFGIGASDVVPQLILAPEVVVYQDPDLSEETIIVSTSVQTAPSVLVVIIDLVVVDGSAPGAE